MGVDKIRAEGYRLFWVPVRAAVALSLGAVMTACSGPMGEQALKLEHVQFLNVRERHPGQLEVSGVATHSSLSIKRIESVLGEQSVQVRVMLVSSVKGLSGRFDYVVVLGDGVESVSFGDERIPIWTRAGGVVVQKKAGGG